MLLEKRISGIMHENPGGHGPPLPPSADDLANTFLFLTKPLKFEFSDVSILAKVIN